MRRTLFLLAAIALACGSAPEDPDKDWVGTWSNGTNELSFSREADGHLQLYGTAVWMGANDVIHTGEIAGPVVGAGGQKVYSDGDLDFACEVNFQLLSETQLKAEDNKRCGGMNVTFDGEYTKVSAETRAPEEGLREEGT